MIHPRHLRDYIINPVLEAIDHHSESAVNQILGTAAVETDMGKYLHQNGGGPGQGPYSMEPATEKDIHMNYLQFRPLLLSKLKKFMIDDMEDQLIGNLYYATAMCRIHYLRSPLKLPKAKDVVGMARMWRMVYNTVYGAGSDDEAIDKFVSKYRKYVLPYI